MHVILKVVPQIQANLSKILSDNKASFSLNWVSNILNLANVLGIYEVESTDPCTKLRFVTHHGSSEIIITNANFTIRSIEPEKR